MDSVQLIRRRCLSLSSIILGAKVLLMENFRSDANIVQAADCFYQKTRCVMKNICVRSRPSRGELREISVTNRKAQYSYLLKVAAGCINQTAVLYRDHECALPLIDLLERNGIPYRMRNADMTFFTNRVVIDISNITKLAADPQNTDLFCRFIISWDVSAQTGCSQNRGYQQKQKLSVWQAALQYGDLDGYVKAASAQSRHIWKHLLEEPAGKAIYRIVQYMGYQDYLTRSEIKDNKLDTLRILAALEESPIRLVEQI